jgi:uncharacterized membrane protein HdeD (DUF308 family)
MLKVTTTIDQRKGESDMPHNVGGVDQAVRIVVGFALLVLGFLHIVTGTLAIAAYIVGAVAIITGLFRFCPAWSIFGINTYSTGPIQHK